MAFLTKLKKKKKVNFTFLKLSHLKIAPMQESLETYLLM